MTAAVRSYLFAPGNRPALLEKVFTTEADAVVLDLEDAVAPADKAEARRRAAAAVRDRRGVPGPTTWVRLNDLRGSLWRDDLEAVVTPGLGGIRVPKAEAVDELDRLDEALRTCEARVGFEPGVTPVTATIESARGVHAAWSIAAHRRVEWLAFGEADFLADIGAEAGTAEATLLARSQLVLAARCAGIAPPIASVHTQLDDEAGLRRTSEQARALGFFGRSCIHPKQLATVHAVFTPDARAVAEARAVVEAWEAARSGAAVSGGQFVDAPVARRARAVLALDASLGSGEEGA